MPCLQSKMGTQTVRLILVALTAGLTVGWSTAPSSAERKVAGREVPSLSLVPDSVAFWDARRGLATSGVCDPGKPCAGGAVLGTGDGGRTFRVVLRTARSAERVVTIGAAGAIVWLDDGRAFLTVDGGRSWRRDRSQIAAHPNASLASWTSAIDTRAVPDTSATDTKLVVLTTDDGGARWVRRRAPCPRALSDRVLIDLASPSRAWLVCLGQGGAGEMGKAVYRTADGGRSWQLVAETSFAPRVLRGGISIGGYPAGIAVTGAGFGLLWETRGTLYVTRDGGSHWAANTRVAEPEVDFGLAATALPDGHAYFLVAHDGTIRQVRLLATSDYGRSWRIVRAWPATG